MNTVQQRLAYCQVILEQVLHNQMNHAEIISKTLKISSQSYLPYKAYNILEKWAINKYLNS